MARERRVLGDVWATRQTEAIVKALEGDQAQQKRLYHVCCQLYGQQSDPALSESDYHDTPELRELRHLISQVEQKGPQEVIRGAIAQFNSEKTEDPDALANFALKILALGRAI